MKIFIFNYWFCYRTNNRKITRIDYRNQNFTLTEHESVLRNLLSLKRAILNFICKLGNEGFKKVTFRTLFIFNEYIFE